MTAASKINSHTVLKKTGGIGGNCSVVRGDMLVEEWDIDRQTHSNHTRRETILCFYPISAIKTYSFQNIFQLFPRRIFPTYARKQAMFKVSIGWRLQTLVKNCTFQIFSSVKSAISSSNIRTKCCQNFYSLKQRLQFLHDLRNFCLIMFPQKKFYWSAL